MALHEAQHSALSYSILLRLRLYIYGAIIENNFSGRSSWSLYFAPVYSLIIINVQGYAVIGYTSHCFDHENYVKIQL